MKRLPRWFMHGRGSFTTGKKPLPCVVAISSRAYDECVFMYHSRTRMRNEGFSHSFIAILIYNLVRKTSQSSRKDHRWCSVRCIRYSIVKHIITEHERIGSQAQDTNSAPCDRTPPGESEEDRCVGIGI